MNPWALNGKGIDADFNSGVLAMMIKKQLGLIVVALAANLAPARADVIMGPTLTSNIFAYYETGLGFSALQDSTLQGFVYQNQGLADQIVLENATTLQVLDILNTPAGVPSYTASGLNWALTGGTDYLLLATTSVPHSNGLYANFLSYPQSDADISVNYQ
jgi:hypothetical protein